MTVKTGHIRAKMTDMSDWKIFKRYVDTEISYFSVLLQCNSVRMCVLNIRVIKILS